MRKAYEEWMADVSTRGYEPPKIHLGTKHENPATLTRQDWRGPHAEWTPTGLGYWEVHIEKSADYGITLRYDPIPVPGEIHFKLGTTSISRKVDKGSDTCVMNPVALKSGPGRLEAWVEYDGKSIGMNYVDVEKQL
jgi:hypothetical protein